MRLNNCKIYAIILCCCVWPVLSLAQQFNYDSQSKRDPFMQLVTSEGRFLQLEKEPEEEQSQDITLDGIIYDPYGMSYALVNGTGVKIGDTINDYQVLKIEEKKVTFIREGQITEILLKKEE